MYRKVAKIVQRYHMHLTQFPPLLVSSILVGPLTQVRHCIGKYC